MSLSERYLYILRYVGRKLQISPIPPTFGAPAEFDAVLLSSLM